MKNITKYIGLFTFIFISSFSFAQADFHTSTTKIEYENESNVINISSRFFTSSLEKVLEEKIAYKGAFDVKLKSYVTNKLLVKINGKPVKVTFVGSQVTDKTTRIYLKVENISSISSLEIQNKMLLEIFNDQQNLMSFDINGVRKSFTSNKDEDTSKITF